MAAVSAPPIATCHGWCLSAPATPPNVLARVGTQGGAIPSCANKGLMNDLARAKWGLDGYITSDVSAGHLTVVW